MAPCGQKTLGSKLALGGPRAGLSWDCLGRGAVKPAAVQAENCATMETLQPPHLPQSFLWAGGVGQCRGGVTVSTLVHLGQLADSFLTWRVLEDSKKNEGLSGAAVFSDSVIMPLKILIVLAVCIGRRPQPLPTWPLWDGENYLGFSWRVLPRRPEMRLEGDLLMI